MFLESAGKKDEIHKLNEKIIYKQDKIKKLENMKTDLVKKIANLDEYENNGNSSYKESLEAEKKKLNKLEIQISDNNENITSLYDKKDKIIRKCLMNLHTQMKKDYLKKNEEHEKYINLYNQAREEKGAIERKIIDLKFLIYKNYNLRLN